MKIEMHAHTAEVSPCADTAAADVVAAHERAGYDAVVITDHFNDYIVNSFSGTPRQKAEQYLFGYRIAREAGERIGIKVFFAAEVCLAGGLEDFLIYGIGEDFIFNNPKMYKYTQRELYNEVSAAGALLFQAHPCRSYCHPCDPGLLHGVEVFNGNTTHPHNNNNDKALAFALSHPHLLLSSGSDFHGLADLGHGGVVLPETAEVETIGDLCGYISQREVELLGTFE
ncbi:MAG: PHP domain-containing protein [Oscillospiraceae bacterium]|nr:PHP domain-containing protein [Oscillospiraceae bacterium]